MNGVTEVHDVDGDVGDDSYDILGFDGVEYLWRTASMSEVIGGQAGLRRTREEEG
jgi:hypothetical protein